jgi:hypothetical protein
MNTNGGNAMPRKIINATGKEITKSFTEIDIMTVGTINNTARSVSSLRLLNDVR